MRDVVWLASYPKSGNTWLRILIGCLNGNAAGDINGIAINGGTSSVRSFFEEASLIDTSLLTDDEIDDMRPAIYGELGRDEDDMFREDGFPVRFVKTHDAYTKNRAGEPLLGGRHAAARAILIVRDPRDVVPSLANHLGIGIDRAIELMNDPAMALSDDPPKRTLHLRQTLLDWSGHASSWLMQGDLPVHVVRYEDLARDAAGCLIAAMRFAGVAVDRPAAQRAAELASFSRLQAMEQETGFFERPSFGSERPFFRRGETGGWRDELSPGQAAALEAAHAPVMARFGYDVSTQSAKGARA